jgi:RNA polymerase sigma factor (sigma-70 family)
MELLQNAIELPPVQSREQFFEDLYEKAFPPFARFAARRGASLQDAQDIFHDALVIYYEKSTDANVVIHTSPEAYVIGTARHLWIRKFHRDVQQVSLDAAEAAMNIPADFYPEKNEARLLRFLEKSGRKCLDLLQSFYFQKASLKEIASSLGYSTEHSAAVQKFKCIGKIRDSIKEQSATYEDFVD